MVRQGISTLHIPMETKVGYHFNKLEIIFHSEICQVGSYSIQHAFYPVAEDPELILRTLSMRKEYSLERMPVHRRTPETHIHFLGQFCKANPCTCFETGEPGGNPRGEHVQFFIFNFSCSIL